MKASAFLEWHYLIFLLPFVAATLLLAVSAIGAAVGNSDNEDASAPEDAGDSVETVDNSDAGEADSEDDTATGGPLAVPINRGRAPALMTGQFAAIGWGLGGTLANQMFLADAAPAAVQLLPSLTTATLCGLVGAKFAGVAATRLMPAAETAVMSRKELFGLTGRVLYPVTEEGGRIRVYDEKRTMHDEPCRVAKGHPPIARGREARIVDEDADGRLVVEEDV